MSIPGTWFDALYARDPDPWAFATSPYEAAKYTATLAALPAAHYAAGFEVGCSIGVLTERLAARCDRLLSVDIAPAALAQARTRCAALAHVTFDCMQVPRDWPSGGLDLIVLSEVLYYLDAAEVAAVGHKVRASLRPQGAVVLVHWLGPTDYPLTADAAVSSFRQAVLPGLQPLQADRTAEYRLDVFVNPAAALAGSAV